MTIKEQIVVYLQNHPNPIDDDDLAKILQLARRQEANKFCHQLEQEGYLKRLRINRKIHNIWLGIPYIINYDHLPHSAEVEVTKEKYKTFWYWEGNVQNTVIAFLEHNGYQILSQANTLTFEKGIDIIAKKGDQTLWVTVKGYPRPNVKVNPRLQCTHWLSSALYDIIKYREKSQVVKLAIALPDFPRYRDLAKQISWFKSISDFQFIWVKEFGKVEKE